MVLPLCVYKLYKQELGELASRTILTTEVQRLQKDINIVILVFVYRHSLIRKVKPKCCSPVDIKDVMSKVTVMVLLRWLLPENKLC